MANLLTYKNFQEKKEWSSHKVISTKEEFDRFYSKLGESDSIWRGTSEAKYKLYTSLQRFWIKENLPIDKQLVNRYLETILEFANKWNLDFLRKYLRNYHIQDYTVYTVLSLLRHHGTPTPLLDWSHNSKVGLFFGAFYCEQTYSDDEISNFFSLYEMKSGHPYVAYDQKNESFEYWKNIEPELRKQNKIPDDDKDFIKKFYQGFLNKDSLFFDDIEKSPVAKIQDAPDDEFYYYINNNYNITNQEGLFIFNVYPNLPLEEAIFQRMVEMSNQQRITQIEIKEAFSSRHKPNFWCYDIHKSLRRYILEKLDQEGINSSYLFPKLEVLANSCVDEFMKKL